MVLWTRDTLGGCHFHSVVRGRHIGGGCLGLACRVGRGDLKCLLVRSLTSLGLVVTDLRGDLELRFCYDGLVRA
jgi:hypothetical protein